MTGRCFSPSGPVYSSSSGMSSACHGRSAASSEVRRVMRDSSWLMRRRRPVISSARASMAGRSFSSRKAFSEICGLAASRGVFSGAARLSASSAAVSRRRSLCRSARDELCRCSSSGCSSGSRISTQPRRSSASISVSRSLCRATSSRRLPSWERTRPAPLATTAAWAPCSSGRWSGAHRTQPARP